MHKGAFQKAGLGTVRNAGCTAPRGVCVCVCVARGVGGATEPPGLLRAHRTSESLGVRPANGAVGCVRTRSSPAATELRGEDRVENVE